MAKKNGSWTVNSDSIDPKQRILFENAGTAIFILDQEFRIITCNHAASDRFEIRCDEMQGRFCWEIVHKSSEPPPDCLLIPMKKSRKRETAILKSKDRWLDITADPILGKAGAPIPVGP